ncbi:MAG: ABC transporter permease [Bacteroidales bacterium]
MKHNIKASQLAGIFFGLMIGTFIIFAAISFFIDVKPIFDDKQSFWKDEYIIINKKITLGDTYSQISDSRKDKPLFNTEEIANIRKQSFVKDVAEFTPCSFMVSAYTDLNSPLAGFYTDLFFESVPDKYIDVNYNDWNWQEGDNFIPTILPKVYLNLYNFGFAQSQNLPQVSEDGAGMVEFNIIIEGQNKQQKFKTRIVGFSESINTILVPKSFIDWANANFGNDPHPKPGRLIVIAKDPASSELADFIEKNNYDVIKSELSNSKALAFLKLTTGIVFIIGMVIILLALAMMVISLQLLLTRNSENIIKLNILGYTISEIARPYKYLISILFSATFIFSLVPLFIFRTYYSKNLIFFGYQNSAEIFTSLILPGLLFNTILVFMLFYLINKGIERIL